MAERKKFTPYALPELPTGSGIDPYGLYLIGDTSGFDIYIRDNSNTVWIKQNCCKEEQPTIKEIILPIGNTDGKVKISVTDQGNLYLEPTKEPKTHDFIVVEGDENTYKISVNS